MSRVSAWAEHRGGNPPIGGRAVAHLPRPVESPAERSIPCGQAAGVAAGIPTSSGDRAEQMTAGYRARSDPFRQRTVAQLSSAVIAPAVGEIAGGDTAGVATAGVHLGEAETTLHRYRLRTLSVGAIAQLAMQVAAPAIGLAAAAHAAGGRLPLERDVRGVGAHPAEAEPAGHRNGL